MRKPGTNEDNAQMSDFICDFCTQQWSETRPMIEGHRGSLICSNCLTLAYDEVWNHGGGVPAPGESLCILCLSHRDELHWESPVNADIRACKRCIKQSVVMLERDPEYGWKRPGASE